MDELAAIRLESISIFSNSSGIWAIGAALTDGSRIVGGSSDRNFKKYRLPVRIR
jgi:hypothetical protein